MWGEDSSNVTTIPEYRDHMFSSLLSVLKVSLVSVYLLVLMCLYRTLLLKTCRVIIDDVEKLDVIQDGFIHDHLLRFCRATRLQYINSHVLLGNRCILQQQHVDLTSS